MRNEQFTLLLVQSTFNSLFQDSLFLLLTGSGLILAISLYALLDLT